jgi:hypothetical protein
MTELYGEVFNEPHHFLLLLRVIRTDEERDLIADVLHGQKSFAGENLQ